MFKKRTININISTITMLKILSLFLGIYFLYLVKDILAIVFVSLILASAIDPWADYLQKRKIPRGLSVIFIYFVLIGIIFLSIYLIIPPIVEQVNELSISFPQYFQKITSGLSAIKVYVGQGNFLKGFDKLNTNWQSVTGGLFYTVSGILQSIVSLFLVLVITFYMVVEENAMKKIVLSFSPKQYQSYILDLINRMQKKIGLWLRGQLILSLIIFLLTYCGLLILDVKYALILSLIAGITEFIPYLGPILAALPAIFLSFAQSPMLALFVIILYYIIQLVEGNIIVPKLMQKVVGLNPIIIIIVLITGFKLGGIIGAILSIPVATALSVVLKDLFERKVKDGIID